MSKLRLLRLQVRTVIARLAPYRRPIIAVLLALIPAVTLGWVWQLASSPARGTVGPLSLAAYGVPGIELRIVYPTRLSSEQNDVDKAGVVTVLARAASQQAVLPLELLLPLPNETVAYVDGQGMHVPGRLSILPGFPDDLPYDIKVVHGNTQLAGSLLRAVPVNVVPALRVDSRVTPLPGLSFRVSLESRSRDVCRRVATLVSDVGVIVVLIGILLLLALWVMWRIELWRRLREGKGVAALYARLQGHVALRRWSEARQEIERIRLQRPYYRDVQQLDGVVAAGETAAWRQKEQYEAGLAAYRSRDWPSAVQAFHAIEVEAPYYREVRFLRRTAALYADLGSRDRSLRIAAARELGEVFKVPCGPSGEGFFQEAHSKLRPVDFASEGAFLCGAAHYPKSVEEAMIQGKAAAGRASRILSKETLMVGGVVSSVDEDKCTACLTCVRICPYDVPAINKDGVASIEAAACQGCGICTAECPAKAIQLLHYRDDQVVAKVDALGELVGAGSVEL